MTDSGKLATGNSGQLDISLFKEVCLYTLKYVIAPIQCQEYLRLDRSTSWPLYFLPSTAVVPPPLIPAHAGESHTDGHITFQGNHHLKHPHNYNSRHFIMATAIHPNQHKLIARARGFLAEVEELLV